MLGDLHEAEELLATANWTLVKAATPTPPPPSTTASAMHTGGGEQHADPAQRARVARGFGLLSAARQDHERAIVSLAEALYEVSLVHGPEGVDAAGLYYQLAAAFDNADAASAQASASGSGSGPGAAAAAGVASSSPASASGLGPTAAASRKQGVTAGPMVPRGRSTDPAAGSGSDSKVVGPGRQHAALACFDKCVSSWYHAIQKSRPVLEEAVEAEAEAEAEHKVAGGDSGSMQLSKGAARGAPTLAVTLPWHTTAQGAAMLQAIVDACAARLGPDHMATSEARYTLGLLLWSRGELTAADACVEHVVASFASQLGAGHPSHAEACESLTRIREALAETVAEGDAH